MILDRQIILMERAKLLGFGYKIFAENIDKQGFCSNKQELSLSRMVEIGELRRAKWGSNRRGGIDGDEIIPYGDIEHTRMDEHV